MTYTTKVILLVICLTSSVASALDVARIEADIALIKTHYRPGLDDESLRHVRILAQSTANKLAAVLDNQPPSSDTYKEAEQLWQKLELSLGAQATGSQTATGSASSVVEVLVARINLRNHIIQQMYYSQLPQTPYLGGTIMIKLSFKENGYLEELNIDSAENGLEHVANLITPSLLTLRIPPQDEPQEFMQPFEFVPGFLRPLE